MFGALGVLRLKPFIRNEVTLVNVLPNAGNVSLMKSHEVELEEGPTLEAVTCILNTTTTTVTLFAVA
jgi:hypothetical protein